MTTITHIDIKLSLYELKKLLFRKNAALTTKLLKIVSVNASLTAG